jgi:hypothetical protein
MQFFPKQRVYAQSSVQLHASQPQHHVGLLHIPRGLMITNDARWCSGMPMRKLFASARIGPFKQKLWWMSLGIKEQFTSRFTAMKGPNKESLFESRPGFCPVRQPDLQNSESGCRRSLVQLPGAWNWTVEHAWREGGIASKVYTLTPLEEFKYLPCFDNYP